METNDNEEYPKLCWLQSDGSFTYNSLKAEWTELTFLDYGTYYIPYIE